MARIATSSPTGAVEPPSATHGLTSSNECSPPAHGSRTSPGVDRRVSGLRWSARFRPHVRGARVTTRNSRSISPGTAIWTASPSRPTQRRPAPPDAASGCSPPTRSAMRSARPHTTSCSTPSARTATSRTGCSCTRTRVSCGCTTSPSPTERYSPGRWVSSWIRTRPRVRLEGAGLDSKPTWELPTAMSDQAPPVGRPPGVCPWSFDEIAQRVIEIARLDLQPVRPDQAPAPVNAPVA